MRRLLRESARATSVATVLGVLLVSVGHGQSVFDARRLAVGSMTDKGRRLALIIGNDSYAGAPLRNARNDARALSEALREMQFDVRAHEDLTRDQFALRLSEFTSTLTADDVVLFFFAGHGVQIEGDNYLIPVDFKGSSEQHVRWNSIRASEVQRDLERARVSMMVFDACRNNPFLGGRTGGTGLNSMEARGSLIAFATAAGKTASDNSASKNGLFTHYLVETLKVPGLTVSDVFKRVRTAVYAASAGQQWPAVYDGLLGDFVLRPGAVSAPPSATRATAIDEAMGLIPGLRWLPVPAGDLTLGCVAQDRSCDSDERRGPARVRVSAFRMLETEVTVAQFKRFAELNGGYAVPPQETADLNVPVTRVTWQEANQFCRAAISGGRLPREAEWEFAARAGSPAVYPWGDQYEHVENGAGEDDGHARLAPVRSFEPNRLGLFDMAGNAREWVNDWYEHDAHQVAAGIDPTGPRSSSSLTRVARGGSFFHLPIEMRISQRKGYAADARWPFLGFRCVAPSRAQD